MWGRLRTAAVFYLRQYNEPEEADSSAIKSAFREASRRAAESLWQYSVLAEEHFGHLLCKSNLHKLNCVLPKQQLTRGHAAWCAEYWIEMLVQDCKRFTKFLTTKTPELLLVNQLLLKSSLSSASAVHKRLQTFDELVPSRGGDPEVVCGSCLDDLQVHGLLGTGAVLSKASDLSEAAQVLDRLYEDFPDTAHKLDHTTGEEVRFTPQDLLRYTYAYRAGVETIHSELYKRTRTRESFYVQVRYEELGARGQFHEVLYVGRVAYFLGAVFGGVPQHDEAQESPKKVTLTLRLAVADLWTATKKEYPTGCILEVENMYVPKFTKYPVEMDKIDSKILRCKPLATSHIDNRCGYFVSYLHTKFDRY